MRKYDPAIRSRYPTRAPLRFSSQQRCLISAAVLFSLLFALDAIPQARTALSIVINNKLLHFVAYAALSTLIYAGISSSPAVRALITLALVGVMGGVEEAIQLMLPYHSANLLGWKFDMLVALTSVGMLMMMHPVFSEWSESRQLRPARIRTRAAPMRQLHRRRDMQ